MHVYGFRFKEILEARLRDISLFFKPLRFIKLMPDAGVARGLIEIAFLARLDFNFSLDLYFHIQKLENASLCADGFELQILEFSSFAKQDSGKPLN